jgi:ATP-dependent RNA helicase DeaD
LVATPGRLLDHLERRSISLSNVHTCVLDEADRMLDMGFIDDVKRILSHVPKERQMVFFSATMPQAIIDLAKHSMNNPEVIKTSEDKLTVEKISQYFILCDPYHKIPILLHFLREKKPKLCIIFVRTKRGADNLFYSLERNGLKAALLHGNLTQARRERSMHSFRHMHSNILVATDIAARGIDVDDVELVFNYNMPEDALIYAHRIGRTARAGKAGEAITFATNMEEKRNLHQFSSTLKCVINELKVEGLNLPKPPEEKEEYRGHGVRPTRSGDRHGGGGRHFGGNRENRHSVIREGGRGGYSQRRSFNQRR